MIRRAILAALIALLPTLAYSAYFQGSVSTCVHPVLTATPTITGTPQVGQLLTSHYTATGTSLVVQYQWQECDISDPFCNSPVVRGTDSTYTPDGFDQGNYVRVFIALSNTCGSASDSSNVVGPIT